MNQMIDFIQGERFIELADNVSIYYRHTHEVNNFFINDAKHIDRKFILISHNSDGNIVDFHKTPNLGKGDAVANLMPDHLAHWFGQNLNCVHPKIESLPIGLENSQWFPELRKRGKIGLKLREERQIDNLLYINHNVNTNPAERLEPYQLFAQMSWCTAVQGKNGAGYDEYIDSIYRHSFVLCPDGNGIDTHRLWECLYLGAIPIVKRGINVGFYRDLPICTVDDWHEISEEFLLRELSRFNVSPLNVVKLQFAFWRDRILDAANSLTAGEPSRHLPMCTNASSQTSERGAPMRFEHQTNPFATHQPVLVELFTQIIADSTKPVLELGAGNGSTPMLHELCAKYTRELVTADDNPDWLNRFKPNYATDWHKFVTIPKPSTGINPDTYDVHWAYFYSIIADLHEDWSLVFIDNAPWSARHRALGVFRDRADYVMVHDVDYFPDHGVFGKTVRPIVPNVDGGERNYDAELKYWREYMQPLPWPAPTGPPTLLGSNRFDRFPEVDFDKYR